MILKIIETMAEFTKSESRFLSLDMRDLIIAVINGTLQIYANKIANVTSSRLENLVTTLNMFFALDALWNWNPFKPKNVGTGAKSNK